MNAHTRVRLMLYEYVQNELSNTDRSFVDKHLSSCNSCRAELKHMEDALRLVTKLPAAPSNGKSDEYWNMFAAAILEASTNASRKQRGFVRELFEWIEHIRLAHPKFIYALGGSLAVCLVVLSFWTFYTPAIPEFSSLFDRASKPLEHRAEQSSPETNGVEFVTVPVQRVNQYFRRSKTLLVGIANLKPEPGQQLDFSAERRVSHDLIKEARYLKQQPIDPRSRHLMTELEKILIELENIKQHNDLPNVEIIRSGIHHENLLFKIRMAEAMYDSTNMMYANEQKEQ